VNTPDFFVPGFPKAGTTTMDALLRQHPDIVMAEPKEPNVFHRAGRRRADPVSAWSHRTNERLVGDASATYLAWPDSLERIRHSCDGPRFIVCLRDPIERTISHFEFRAQKGLETRSFQAVLDVGWKADPLLFSRYGQQLTPWMNAFGQSQFLFVHLPDLERDAPSVMSRVYEFLEVDEHPVEPIRANATRPRGSSAVASVLSVAQPVAHHAPRRLKPAMRQMAAKLYGLGRTPGRYTPSRAQVQHLVELFEPEVVLLEEVTGLDLSSWRARWAAAQQDPASFWSWQAPLGPTTC
jgi:hypothetical protein